MVRLADIGNVFLQSILAAIIYSHGAGAMATSRLGTAVISDSAGLPCFSVESNRETIDGVPLDVIVVTEKRLHSRPEIPVELWHFVTNYPSQTRLSPNKCIRYGEPPLESVQRTLKPLKPYVIYSVGVIARKENSGVLGYFLSFCITTNKLGGDQLNTFKNDESKGNEQYELCARPE